MGGLLNGSHVIDFETEAGSTWCGIIYLCNCVAAELGGHLVHTRKTFQRDRGAQPNTPIYYIRVRELRMVSELSKEGKGKLTTTIHSMTA